MPMRSGKTKAVIDTMCILQMKYGIKRVVIVAPLSVLGVWRNQIRIHKPDGFNFHIVLLNYEMVYDRKRYKDDTWEPIKRRSLYKFKPDLIIVDESHKIGDPSAVQSKHLYYLQKEFPDCYKIIMTGTPFHRKPHRTYGQFRFVDESIFPMSFTAFKNKVSRWGGYGNVKYLGAKNEKWFIKKISRGTFMMKTLPFVKPQHEVVPYELEESLPMYRSMADESIALLSNGSTLEAPIALTRALRLSQLCGGRLRDSEGSMVRVGMEKKRAFAGLVDQFLENEVEKFVVGHRFVPEMADSVRVCQKAGYKVYLMYGATDRNLREQRIAEFDEVEGKAAFICQVQTGALGIDLSAASVCVYYSLPESLVDYDQFCARIRKWKDKRTLTYYYLTGKGTIEEVHIAALRANLDLIDALERDPMLLSYEAVG
jgi:superfamily II DNA or RNA helicase